MDKNIDKTMLKNMARSISPFKLQQMDSDIHALQITHANHPVLSECLLVVSFIDPDQLYVAVIHSDSTLGPLLGELVACKVWDSFVHQDGHTHNHNPPYSKFWTITGLPDSDAV
jgi:hypothetical protein